MDLIREDWSPAYVVNDGVMQDFFSVFAVYFPAGIGILAGANISRNLKVSLVYKVDNCNFDFDLKLKQQMWLQILNIICAGSKRRYTKRNDFGHQRQKVMIFLILFIMDAGY